MARRTLNRHELRAEAEAAEAMGLTNPDREEHQRTRASRPCAQARGRAEDADRLGRLRRRRTDGQDF